MSHQQLSEIQARLVAPKGQTNAFGKYKYRSCEDILEAVKPILAEFNATLNGLFAIDDTKDADTKDNSEAPKVSLSVRVLEDFKQCKTMDELQSLWSAIDNKTAYSSAKNAAKARLA